MKTYLSRVVIGALVAASLFSTEAHAAEPTEPGYGITLVTGDKVVLGGAGGATIRPAKGRERIQFLTQRDTRGDTHVTPVDALSGLRSGQLDPRLFNVSQLMKHGFGDATRPDIPLIVTGTPGVRSLPSVNATAIKVAKNTGFWNSRHAARIWLDGPVKAMLDKSVPQIGAPVAWQAGLTGKDTKVAVLDTGIDHEHPDLLDAVVEAKDFTGSASGTQDKHGHGTHVASTVTGKNDKYTGVAPDAKLVIGKVLNDRGSGTESGVIAGMEWAANSGARVINMSLGSEMPSDGTDVVSQAVNTLTAQSGALFVIAAGNNGDLVGSPAAADAALTVGAVDSKDALADFSSIGPRFQDNAIKPDITAPGVDIVAAKAKGSFLADRLPNVGEHHLMMSGTSMAAPHVAGAAAILAQQHPAWQAAELKAALMNSAKPQPGVSIFKQGAGRVDVARAVSQTVWSAPASVSNGVVRWPHTDDKPITNVLTYNNSGATDVSLTFTVDVRDPAGKAAPAGMFKVSPATVVVPAGGQAQASLVIDTTVTAPDGLYSGLVTAGDLRTPISVTREPESYDTKLEFVGFDGKPTPDYALRIISFNNPYQYQRYDASGSLTVRLPKGKYFLEAQLRQADRPLVVMTEPGLDVSKDVSLKLDARDAKPAGLALDRTGLRSAETFVELSSKMAWGTVDSAVRTEFGDVIVRPSTTSAHGEFRYSVGGRFAGESLLYNVRGDANGKVPADPVLKVRDRDLVKVKSVHGATRPGTSGGREGLVTKPLPYTLDELYSPGVGWHGSFSEVGSDGNIVQNIFTSEPRSFTQSTVENWNHGVFGPVTPVNSFRPARYASRAGDTMFFGIPMYSDSGVNREGFSANTGTTALYRDEVEIAKRAGAGGGIFEVPPGKATYRLHVESTRDRALSSKIVADFTFASDTTSASSQQPLPLMTLRFTPSLDSLSRASRVLPTIVPVSVGHNTKADARPTRVEVSHDKGTTWRAVPLVSFGGKWYTVISHPRDAASVSLRASARDSAGNSVNQTVIDAFGLK
ncbi:S8 family serine peptidase [Kibdelosporangium philippinense]|uniref:S8 family serine peptidase n=1 Tax=Kibdelosporangium philippinense TaxID=211113 RepID=A0ABS8ZUY4_9PSEU|nr:S8 family serine peptidase [Kibdelosporangium philippinense]MCE7010795.1 S8 family serine peptidase [Kibdelosporangium philippinense]